MKFRLPVSKTVAHQTVKYDILRGVLEGPITAGSQSLALLILLKGSLGGIDSPYSDMLQSVLFGSTFVGMAGSIFFLYCSSRYQLAKTKLISIPTVCASFSIILSSVYFEQPFVFTILLALGFFFMAIRLPILTSIYHENYPTENRGRLTSLSFMATQISTAGFFYLAGRLLDYDMSMSRWILLFWGAVGLLSAWISLKIPSKLKIKVQYRPKELLFLPFKDRWFGYVLLVWFVFGFANLWILPLRVKYVIAELDLKASTITLILGTIPELTRLLFLPFWAFLFDRINFIVLRMLLNAFLGLGIGILFHSVTAYGVALGAFFHAVGFSGGKLAWSLWVTKMTPKSRSAEYMAIHVFLTGLRGALGPFVGVWVLLWLSRYGDEYRRISTLSVGMIMASLLMLIPLVKGVNTRESDALE